MTAIGLGFRAVRGGSVVVAVALDGRAPQVVRSTFLATATEGDRLSLEPYHVAYEMRRAPQGGVSAEARAAVAEGRKRQDRLAAKGLDDLVRALAAEKYRSAVAALLVNRAGWLTDLLEHSLSAPEHPPVTEGLAVREALRSALKRSRIKTIELDEKSLLDTAAQQLRLSSADIERRLKELGTSKPWRKEQKLACLAAWLALAGLNPQR